MPWSGGEGEGVEGGEGSEGERIREVRKKGSGDANPHKSPPCHSQRRTGAMGDLEAFVHPWRCPSPLPLRLHHNRQGVYIAKGNVGAGLSRDRDT